MSGKRLHSETQNEAEQTESSQKLVAFAKADVPVYLHKGGFYLSLAEDDDQQILVPSECFKDNDFVASAEDLRSLLLTQRFWIIDEIGDSILDFVFSHPFESYEEVIAEFYDDMPDLKHLELITMAKKPFQEAINRDVLTFVRYMHNTGKHEWPEDACTHLAEQGRSKLLKCAIESGCVLTTEAAVAAAIDGHLSCLRLLREHHCPWDERTTGAAAFYGNLDCLQYAHENGCPWTASVSTCKKSINICTVAAGRGYLECLKYAHAEGAVFSPETLMVAVGSSRNGTLECVKYLHSQGLSLGDQQLCIEAIRENNFEMLKYLHENGCPLTRDCYIQAVGQRETGIFEYLHAHGCLWDVSVCECAAEVWDFHAVLFLLRNGCPPSDNIWSFRGDAFRKISNVFEEIGLPWTVTPNAMTYVVGNGDLNAVKQMREKGFPWTADTCATAAVTASLDLLTYVHTHGADNLHIACGAIMSEWARTGNYTANQLECFKYARQHGNCILYKDYTFQAARDGQLELLTYLHKQGCKWDAKAAVAAAKNGHADCLEYLLSQGCPHSKDIVIVATKRKQVKCLEVAKKYGCV